MRVNMQPFNLDLLIVDQEMVKSMNRIKVLDIFDGLSKNFHPDGLFSTEIFGKAGEERRNRLFSYIDLRIPVFHPVVYKCLTDLKQLYGEILAGTTYAIFDRSINDFVKASELEGGQTGYNFFLDHFQSLQFEKRPSAKREFAIKLVEKYRSKCMIAYLVVMPAGLRDMTFDENGKPSEDEINDLYRKIMSITNLLEGFSVKDNLAYADKTRYGLQMAVNDVFNYIKSMLEGKSKFIQSRWAGRKIRNSTRNVITSYIPTITKLRGPKNVSTTQTVVSLYQFLRATLPLAVHNLRNGFLGKVFIGNNAPAVLVNKTTLKKEMVNVDPDVYDSWMTFEGLEKIMAKYGREDLRHNFLEVEGYYMGLIYKGPDGTYRFMQDIDELPEGRNKEDVHPITYTELLYLSNYIGSSEIPAFVTRYPVTGYGSIYPSFVYLKSTVRSDIRKELDDNWEPTGNVANEFPIYGASFYNSMSPSRKHLVRLGADFDGDMMSFICLLSMQARMEVKKTLNSRKFYIAPNGKMAFSASNDVIDLVLSSITG